MRLCQVRGKTEREEGGESGTGRTSSLPLSQHDLSPIAQLIVLALHQLPPQISSDIPRQPPRDRLPVLCRWLFRRTDLLDLDDACAGDPEIAEDLGRVAFDADADLHRLGVREDESEGEGGGGHAGHVDLDEQERWREG